MKSIHKVGYNDYFSNKFKTKSIHKDLQNLTNQEKTKLIETIIDYIFLNFKQIELAGLSKEMMMHDEELLKRRAIRKDYDDKRNELFGPRKAKNYDVGIDLGEKKRKVQTSMK